MALGSFGPEVARSIVSRYNIADYYSLHAKAAKKWPQEFVLSAEEAKLIAERSMADKNRLFWKNIIKATGVASLIGAIGAWWYFKKK